MNKIMICVTLQNTCDRLINAALEYKKGNDKLFVLHVAKNGQSFMNSTNSAFVLEYLHSICKDSGADMTVIHSDDVQNAIVDYVENNKINIAVFGLPGKNDTDNGFIEQISNKLKDKCQIILVQKGE